MEERLLSLVKDAYDLVGWPGVAVLMAVESACIPFPSEVIMPFAAWFLVRSAGLGVWWIFPLALVGAVGNLVGSLMAYWLGIKGARPFLVRYGKYLLISSHDLDVADRWFAKKGDSIIFFSRLIPVVRTFISLSAGVSHMNLTRFSIFTFAGCYIFSLGLAYGGYVLGQKWDSIQAVMRPFNIPIAAASGLTICFYIWRHYRQAWNSSKSSQEQARNPTWKGISFENLRLPSWVMDPVICSLLLVAGIWLSIAGWATRHLWDSDRLFAASVACFSAGLIALFLHQKSRATMIPQNIKKSND